MGRMESIGGIRRMERMERKGRLENDEKNWIGIDEKDEKVGK